MSAFPPKVALAVIAFETLASMQTATTKSRSLPADTVWPGTLTVPLALLGSEDETLFQASSGPLVATKPRYL